MRTSWIWSLALSAAVAVLGLPVQAQTVLKAGHINPKDSGEGVAADRFGELVKQKTRGAIAIEVFPSEQLGKAVAQIDSTVIGNQDIYIGGAPEFERFSAGLKALGLFYAVPSQVHFRKIMKSPVWKEIFDDPLDKVGLVAIDSDWERGPYRVIVSTKPIKTFDDLKGLKVRIAPLDTWRRSYAALGASAIVLAWTDVYLGLKTGQVEAVTSPIDLVWPNKFTEIAKYVSRFDEFWGLLTVVMNKKKYEGLSADHRKAVVEAANQAGDEYMASAEKRNAEHIDRMKKEHGVTFADFDLKPGIEKMKPVIAELEKEGFIPAGIYAKFQAVR